VCVGVCKTAVFRLCNASRCRRCSCDTQLQENFCFFPVSSSFLAASLSLCDKHEFPCVKKSRLACTRDTPIRYAELWFFSWELLFLVCWVGKVGCPVLRRMVD